MKNVLEGINSKLKDAEEQISDLKDRVVESNEQNNKMKTILKNENRLRDLWQLQAKNLHSRSPRRRRKGQ